MQLLSQSKDSLIADYAERMGESLLRRQAELEVRTARMEADLAIKARSEFLSNMNHELRTPLNAIIGFATMLRDASTYNLGEEQQQGYAEYILQSADLLLGHINTILEIAALDSGAVEMCNDVVDMNDLLTEAIDALALRIKTAGVTIERHGQTDQVLAWGDVDRTRQTIDHLLQIAVKSSADGGNILVKARINEDGWGELAVRDNGVGFTPAELHDALEAFNQVHRGLNRPFAGPSVGYAVAKTFVEMQGGRFDIESHKDEGTLAMILLPPPQSSEDSHPAETDTAPVNPAEKSHDAA